MAATPRPRHTVHAMKDTHTPTVPRAGGSKAGPSPTIRKAIKLIVLEGLSQTAVAERLKINRTYLNKALALPEAKALMNKTAEDALADLDTLADQARRMAYLTGMRLMGPDNPVATQAKMVELFSRERKGDGSVNVNLGLSANPDLGGYAYRRPALDVTPNLPTDHKSGNSGQDD